MMFIFLYEIIMQTPLGEKHGIMQIEICQSKVSGYIEILKNKESFQGQIDENGVCLLYGRIVTLVQKINFTAFGIANEKEVNLVLHGEGQNDTFHITGKTFSQEGEA